MFDFLLNGLNFDNVNAEVKVSGYDITDKLLFEKKIELKGHSELVNFVKSFMNKDWDFIFYKTQSFQYIVETNRIEVTDIKFYSEKY